MIVHRQPDDEHGITRVLIYPDAAHVDQRMCHQVICSDFDYTEAKGRQPPAARIHLLGTVSPLYYEDVQRLSHDYQLVADIAMKLEEEKRAAYAVRFPTANP